MKNEKVYFENGDLTYIGIIFFITGALLICLLFFRLDFILNEFSFLNEWDKLKSDCELSAILDNGNYQYACKIESNPTTVIYDKLDAHDWERFKIKNNCQLIQINLTVKNKKQWSCDNNVNFYYDDK